MAAANDPSNHINSEPGDDNDAKEESRRPKDSKFRQQKVRAWTPILTPRVIVAWFVGIAAIFIPIGVVLLDTSDDVVILTKQYDGDGTNAAYADCAVTSQDMTTFCQVPFMVEEDMDPPIYVYYELGNYFQNHRRYVKSRSASQLLGLGTTSVTDCDPVKDTDDGYRLNPCGLIANSFFTDQFTIASSTGAGFSTATAASYLDETDISWKVDRDDRFVQPKGFHTVQVGATGSCTSASTTDANCAACLGEDKYPCLNYTDSSGAEHLYYYPEDNQAVDAEGERGDTQYLYATYPDLITPLEGVENEHFQVWMRAAGLPRFRKIYGVINDPLVQGDELVFNVTASYYVQGFDGKKSIVLSTLSKYGAKNDFLGVAYLVLGCISILAAAGFTIMALKYPRELGDPRFVDAAQYLTVK